MTDNVLKVMERSVEKGMSIIFVDEIKFVFLPAAGITDATFIIYLEKIYHCIPRKVLQWSMRNREIPEWIITIVEAIYNDAKCWVRVDC